MSNRHFDLIVIGSGPGGEKGAAQAAYFSKKVLLIEQNERLGGACIHSGTIPSKTLRETALYYAGLKQRELYGLSSLSQTNLTVEGVMTRKDKVVDALSSQVETNVEVNHQVQVVRGTGILLGGKRVRVVKDAQVQEFRAGVILLATGSRPYRPRDVPFDSDRVFDSDSVLKMPFLPQQILNQCGNFLGAQTEGNVAGVYQAEAPGRGRGIGKGRAPTRRTTGGGSATPQLIRSAPPGPEMTGQRREDLAQASNTSSRIRLPSLSAEIPYCRCSPF